MWASHPTKAILLFFITQIVKKQLSRPYKTLYRHAKAPDFMRVWAYRPRSVVKVLATYFCEVGRDFLACEMGNLTPTFCM